MFIRKNVVSILLVTLMVTTLSSVSFAQVLTLATDPLGTGTYGATAGIGKILNEYTKYNVKVKPTTGATEIGPLLAFGEVELGTMHNWEAEKCWRTDMHYDEPLQGMNVAPMRIIMGGPPTMVSPVVREDAGIETGADLAGKKYVGVYTGSASGLYQSKAALANFGLSEDDVEIISVPGWGDAIQALIDGRADAAGTSTPGQAILKELDAKRGARFLSLDFSPEAIEAYREWFPASPITVEPSPDLTGVKGTTNMMYFEDFIIANPDLVKEDMAYELTKALYENFKELQELHVNLSRMNIEGMVSLGASVPYHPGAIKFYKEVGIWTEEAEALSQKLLALEEELKNQ